MLSLGEHRGLASMVLLFVGNAAMGCGARVSLEQNPGTTTGTSTSTGVSSGTSTSTSTGIPSGTSTSTSTGFITQTATSTRHGSTTAPMTTTATYTSTGSYVTYPTTATYTSTGSYVTYPATATYTMTGTGVVTGIQTATAISVCGTAYVPAPNGALSIAAGYVTTGTLHGYGFTWKTDNAVAGTCISPTCNTTGCTPAFAPTSLCAAGGLIGDFTYNSAVGVGFNLNQDAAGGSLRSVAAPASVTVFAAFPTYASGNASARLQLVDAGGTAYCVEAGAWASGMAVPTSQFNTSCWDPMMGRPLPTGTPITSIHIVIPSSIEFRPFSVCLLNVFFS